MNEARDKIKFGTNLTFTPVECKIMHSVVFIYSNIVFYVFKRYTYGRLIAIGYLKLDFGVSRVCENLRFCFKNSEKETHID